MRGSEVIFYADSLDMKELLGAFNKCGSFTYTQTLSELDRPLLAFASATELLQFLRTDHPQASIVFLVTDETAQVNTQRLTMSDGSGFKLKADQALNPDAVLIKLGGQLRQQVLIATSINTTGETLCSRENFKLLKKLILRKGRLLGGSYVQPGAYEKLVKGWRLTPDPGFSPTLDIQKPEICSQ